MTNTQLISDETRANASAALQQAARPFQSLLDGLAAAAPLIEENACRLGASLRQVAGPDAFRCDGTGEPWTP